MSVRVAAVAAAVLGGALWIFRGVAGAPEAVHWVGLALVALSLAPVGARLVSGVVPVRVLVAVALPLLVASLVELVRPAGPGWFEGVLGVVTVVVAVGVLAATSQPERSESRHRAH